MDVAKYKQQRTQFNPSFITSFMTREPRPHQSKWWKVPLSKKESFCAPLSKRCEEVATFPAHGKASCFWSTSSGNTTIRIKEDGSREEALKEVHIFVQE
ncbi:hypothetical protein AAHA92_01270 [Salvia divinorum]|uniref:Uncharacterized protein n=1 Tax=Salvia divinorum TaxID=28513 RepID=A0ABD1IMA9_SALDI